MLLLSDVKDFEKAAKGLSGMVMYVMLPAAEPAIINKQYTAWKVKVFHFSFQLFSHFSTTL